MKSRIKSIVGVFLTVGIAKVNICSFLVATLTLTAGDGLMNQNKLVSLNYSQIKIIPKFNH
jgi:hypothetical protein